MVKNLKNIGKKKIKPTKKEEDSIAILKEKIKYQKEALNKIIRNYSKE